MRALSKAFGGNLQYTRTPMGYQIVVDDCYIGMVSHDMANDPHAGSEQLAHVTMEMLMFQRYEYVSRCANPSTISNGQSMKIGDRVIVADGCNDELKEMGFIADYMTEHMDGKTGVIVSDHREVVTYPHWGVDVGFEKPVGIPERFIIVIEE